RLMREFSGMSTTQFVDKIRAEKVRGKMREYLKRYVIEKFGKPGTPGKEKSLDGHVNRFWFKLKDRRKSEIFSYGTWAIDLGFANYTRFYRACLLHYKKTPSQVEHEILCDFANWYVAAQQLSFRKKALDEPQLSNPEWAVYRKPYSDWLAYEVKAR